MAGRRGRESKVGLTTKQWLAGIAGTAVGAGIGVYGVLVPQLTDAAPEWIDRALAENLNGTVQYEQLHINGNLDVTARDVIVRDAEGRTVAALDGLTVGWTIPRLAAYLLTDREALSVIDRIELDAPTVYLREEADRSWNINTLIKEKDTQTPFSLRAKIAVNDGRAELTFQDEPPLSLQSIQALVDLAEYPQVTGDVRLAHASGSLHARGSYTSADDFALQAEGDRTPLILAMRVLPQDIPLQITAGEACEWTADVSRREGVLSYRVKGRLEDGALTYDDTYHVADLTGDVEVDPRQVSFWRTKLTVNEQPLEAQGRVLLQADPALDVDIRTTGVEANRLAAIPLQGKVAGNVHIGGTTTDLAADGALMMADGRWEDTPISRAFARFTYRSGVVRIADAVTGIGDGRVRGSGYYNLQTKSGRGDVRLTNVDAALLPLSESVTGIINGTAQVAAQDGAVQAEAILQGTGVGARGVTADTAMADIAIADGDILVRRLTGTADGGTFSATGTWGDTADLRWTANDLPLARLAPAAGVDMAGRLTAAGTVAGPTDAPDIEASVSARDGAIKGVAFRRVTGHVRYADGRMILQDGRWLDEDGMQTVAGTIDLRDNGRLDLRAQGTRGRLEHWLAAAGMEGLATGWFDHALTVGGTIDAPEVQGAIHAWDGSVAGELYQDMRADYRYAAGAVAFDARASLYNGTVTATGTASPSQLNIDWVADHIDVDRILRERNTMQAQGFVRAQGRIVGRPDDPAVYATVTGDGLTVNGEAVEDASAEVAYHGGVVALRHAQFRQHDGVYRFDGSYRLPTGAIEGAGEVTAVEITRLLHLVNADMPHLTGLIDGRIQVRGTTENPGVSVRGRWTQGAVRDLPIGDTALDVSLADRVVRIRQLRMPLGEGVLAAQGTAALDGDVDMQVAAQHIDARYLQAFMNQEPTLTGDVRFSAVVTGKTASPSVDMSFDVANGTYNHVAFDHFIGLLNLEDGVIRINQTLLERDPYRLSVYGTVPVAALTRQGRSDNASDSMQVEVKLDKADLELLTAISPSVTAASGATRGGLVISGTLADPRVDGRIYVEDGSLTLATMHTAAEHIRMDLNFAGKTADWKLRSDIGGGVLTSEGDMYWDQAMPYRLQGTLRADRINPKSDYYNGTLNADLALGMEGGLPSIAGTVDTDHTKIDIPFTFSDSGEMMPIALDVAVRLGEGTRLYNSYLYDLDIDGEVHARGTTAAPDMSGRVNVRKGHLKYLNNKFRVAEGYADFNSGSGFLPNLYVDAATTFNQYRIRLQATGLPTALDLQLSSEPNLTKEEIVTMLTLHTGDINDLSKADANILLGAAAQMLIFGSLEGRLQETFGLDMINITTGSLDPFTTTTNSNTGVLYNIEIGKYLFDDFMLTAATGVNNRQYNIGFRYDINRHLSAGGWANSEHNYYIGTQWKWRF